MSQDYFFNCLFIYGVLKEKQKCVIKWLMIEKGWKDFLWNG